MVPDVVKPCGQKKGGFIKKPALSISHYCDVLLICLSDVRQIKRVVS